MQNYSDLELFWHRYNKVLLERLCLEREKDVMTQENEHLRVLLRQYLDGISVSDEILRHRNPLLMVSRPTLIANLSKDGERKRHTVIEASHVVQRIL